MKIVRNKVFPFKGFSAINLFGVIFLREDSKMSEFLINHEQIHTAQMKELGYILFYVIYFFEWLVRLFLPGNAYRNISFEKEAYTYDKYTYYCRGIRKSYAMWRKRRD